MINKYNNFEIIATWIKKGVNKDDFRRSEDFSENIRMYIELFKQLPNVGLRLDNQGLDIASIKYILFDGLSKSIIFDLEILP